MKTVIAIDGPAASGKSSVARELAARLDIAYVNSGAFYRAITWWILQEGVVPDATEAVSALIARADLRSGFQGATAYLLLNDRDATPHLEDPGVNRQVSVVSRIPAVREHLMTHLHRLANERDLVMEGRDIGSVVFPDTPYKFYIDASPEVRAQRRKSQGQQDEIATRDQIDSSRPNAPLIIAEDALVIDSTHLTVDDVVGKVVERLKLRGLSLPLR